MKCVYILVILLTALAVNAQKKTDPAELYPVFKSLKVKWERNLKNFSGPTDLNECINGNCADGEGVRLATGNVVFQSGGYGESYTLPGTILKGQFSEGGNRFYGKVYAFKMYVGTDKKEKELRLSTPLDVTDDAAMKAYYIGEGAYHMGQYFWDNGWDGEVKDHPALSKLFPDAEIHKAAFTKNALSWIDVGLPANHRFIRYTGHSFASGDFMFGKALLDNGDVYEGFFLRHSFHGPGKLTKRSGKIQQGIWQIDSLMQEVVVAFPESLLQPVLTKPAKFNISELNGMDVNSFKHSTTEINIFAPSEFYGDVVNNEASGWGLWKTNFTKGNANANDDVQGFAFGYWKHNQLDGPGIYFTTAMHEFWINTGVYKQGKIVQGNSLVAEYSRYGSTASSKHGFPELNVSHFKLSTNPLQGCGVYMEVDYHSGYESKPRLSKIIEGYYSNGKLSGFYFEDDTAKKRSYDLLKFPEYHRNWKFTEDLVKSAESSNNFCFDAIRGYKPLLVAEMKNVLAKNIEGEAWAKSPEGQAHKRRVEEENRRYAEGRKKECDAEFAKIGVKGRTYLYKGSSLVVLEGYDCDKKEYIAWRPRQGNDIYSDPPVTQVRGLITFLSDKLEPSVKQYHTCEECNGTGQVLVTTTTTRTKELPWGYFSGIETKSIRTTTKEELKMCSKCKGSAIVLK
jgi:hypothetical protein